MVEWLNRFVNHNYYISDEEMEKIEDELRKEFGINRFSTSKLYNKYELAKEIIRRYPKKVKGGK